MSRRRGRIEIPGDERTRTPVVAAPVITAPTATALGQVLQLLDAHHQAFMAALPAADETKHPVPCDTKAWSQILVSLLTGIPGIARKKGPDLADGSDVKGANAWEAIDRPRFNGVAKAGRIITKDESVASFDTMPYVFFVLWDRASGQPRCRVWCVRSASDPVFRDVCARWYGGSRKSTNLQLHPPINTDSNVVKNRCGNIALPLLYCAVRRTNRYEQVNYNPTVLETGLCEPV